MPRALSINFVFDLRGPLKVAWSSCTTRPARSWRLHRGKQSRTHRTRGDPAWPVNASPSSTRSLPTRPVRTFHINQVTHGYRDALGQLKGPGDSGSCNNNVAVVR